MLCHDAADSTCSYQVIIRKPSLTTPISLVEVIDFPRTPQVSELSGATTSGRHSFCAPECMRLTCPSINIASLRMLSRFPEPCKACDSQTLQSCVPVVEGGLECISIPHLLSGRSSRSRSCGLTREECIEKVTKTKVRDKDV